VTRLHVAGLLREPPGAVRSVELGDLEWPAEGPLPPRRVIGTLRLQRTNRGILASGRARTLARRTCTRCLDEFDEPVEVDLNEEFLPTVDPVTGAAVQLDPTESDLARIDAGQEIDLAPVLADELALAEPMQPLCRPDCRGLCPVCGRRLDDPDHADHDLSEVDPRLASLADWKPPQD
jgi:uncharacterized protein